MNFYSLISILGFILLFNFAQVANAAPSLGKQWLKAYELGKPELMVETLRNYYEFCSRTIDEMQRRRSLMDKMKLPVLQHECNRFPLAHDGYAALRVAVKQGLLDVVEFILKSDDPGIQLALVKHDQEYLGNAAHLRNKSGAMLQLLTTRIPPSSHGNMAIHISLERCESDAMVVLFSHPKFTMSWSVDVSLKRAVETCPESFLYSLVTLIDNPGFPAHLAQRIVTKNDQQLFISACERGFDRVVEELLTNEWVDISARENEALKRAARAGEAVIVRILLNLIKAQEVSAYDEKRKLELGSAFGNACLSGSVGTVMAFISRGVMEVISENSQRSALLLAFIERHSNIVKLLLSTNKFDLSANGFQQFLQGLRSGDEQVISAMLERPELYHSFVWNRLKIKGGSDSQDAFKVLASLVFCQKRGCSAEVERAFSRWVRRFPYEYFNPEDASDNLNSMWNHFNGNPNGQYRSSQFTGDDDDQDDGYPNERGEQRNAGPSRGAAYGLQHFYRVLGLPVGASATEIKQKFYQLALQYHPDKTKGDPEKVEKFKEILKAKDALLGGAQ